MKTMIRERNVIFFGGYSFEVSTGFLLVTEIERRQFGGYFFVWLFLIYQFCPCLRKLYTYCTQSKRKQLLQNGGEIKS
jgi:hypothetical protein